MGSPDGVMVAASKHSSSLSALKWALAKKLVPQGGTIKLVHVRPPVRSIPTPMGNFVPIEQVSSDIVVAYIRDIQAKTDQDLLGHLQLCHKWKVQAEVIIVESDTIAEALVEQVSRLGIQKLIIGTSTSNPIMRKLKGSSVPMYVTRCASDSCTVLIVCKGKLVSAKEGKDVISGTLPSLDDANSAVRDVRDVNHAAMQQHNLNGFISQPLSIQRDRATSTINFKRGCSDLHNLQNHSGLRGPKGSQVFISPFWSPDSLLQEVRLLRSQEDDSDASRPEIAIGVYRSHSSEEGDLILSSSDAVGAKNHDLRGRSRKSRISQCGSSTSLADPLRLNSSSVFVHEDTQNSSESERKSMESVPVSSLLKGNDEGKQIDEGVLEEENFHPENDPNKWKLELELAQQRAMVAEEMATIASRKVRELDAFVKEEARKREQAIIVAQLAKLEAAEEAIKFDQALAALESARLAAEEEADRRRKAEERAYREALNRQKAMASLLQAQTRYREYDFEELKAATNGFSEDNQIGEGGYGMVYRGKLHHTTVAIKVLRQGGVQGLDEFQREVELLGRLHHPHMVLLVGACPEQGCLVYEYLANGSLEDRLLCKGNSLPLPWQARFRIAAEVATALLFLHTSRPDPIVHRDLKPANILLDQNFVSKIGDVGLARLALGTVSYSVTEYRETVPVGTMAYIDPEYQRTGVFCPRSDVYALGLVILQLLTGRGPIGLTAMVSIAIEDNTFTEILDPTAGEWPINEALDLAHLGLQCAELRRKDRPDLETFVLPKLEKLRDFRDEHTARTMWSKQVLSDYGRAVPSFFLCPIYKEVMEDPHIAADGFTYEHSAIKQWLESNDTSPMTNLKLSHKQLTPNHSLRSSILEWRQKLACT